MVAAGNQAETDRGEAYETAAGAAGAGAAGAGASFGGLLRAEFGRLLRRGGTVFCALVLPPLYAIVIGLLFGANLLMPVGGFGSPGASMIAFPAVVIAAFGLLLTPVDLASRRAAGELSGYADRPGALLAADLLARLLLVLAGIALAFGIGMLAFGVRPGAGSLVALGTLMAAALGAAAFLAIGQLLAVLLPSARVARVLGHVLLYPLVLLSGAVFPLGMLPGVMAALSPVSPVTHLVRLLHETWLSGPAGAILLSAGVLAALFVLAGGLAVRRARRAWA